ncbi:hypothetical protein [Povalibacter sp.]|uniref:hypothetical protein n=1 Tax=Povalibacter sp. TaxID=1962978 RepID=UPI002F3F261C
MRTEIVDSDQERAKEILTVLARSHELGHKWRYVELRINGWLYAGWVRSKAGVAEGHTLSIVDQRH